MQIHSHLSVLNSTAWNVNGI